jgi:predicted DNA-binding transcriptional regulator
LANDRAVGASVFVGSVVGVIIYGILMFYFSLPVLQLTAFLSVAIILGILSWIGYTMATTPAPEPLSDVAQSPPGPAAEPGKEPE